MKRGIWAIGLVMVLMWVTGLQANVFSMGGIHNPDGTWTGLASLETVMVGNPGNPADTQYGAHGSVNDTYNIGKYEVTAGQYCEFLNAVAKNADPYGLYNPNMADVNNAFGCNIQRFNVSGSYRYTVLPYWANCPVNYVNFWDSCRFTNWLSNGQPTGDEGPGTTETGAYTLTTDGIANNTIVRNAGATWVVPNVNEWYKAAYYDPNKPGGQGYWEYTTKSDSAPINVLSPTGTNNANFYDSYGTGNGSWTVGSLCYRTQVGAFASSPGPYGTFDQGGNVWEFYESYFDSYRGRAGGAFNSGGPDHLSSLNIQFTSATYETYEHGFRVAEVPEPASIVLLVLGGLALLPQRKI